MKFHKGDRVTVRVAEPAYGSNYGGNPVQLFAPGMIGTVNNPDVPAVMTPGGRDRSFCTVDFQGVEHGTVEYPNTTWRAGVYPSNLLLVSRA
jgi:hypothetical protein